MKEASYYVKSNSSAACELCKFHCVIPDGACGHCMMRENHGGVLYSRSYDNVISMAADPVEKKPLFHVAPGSIAYSYAAEGCNFTCAWRQNYQISQQYKVQKKLVRQGYAVPPAQIVREAVEANATVLAATYTEPTIFYELAHETGLLAKEEGLINAWVTNGSIEAAPLKNIAPFLDAANVDLKGVDDEKTRLYTGMKASKVMETIELMLSLGVWVELTTLLVPGFNDKEQDIERCAKYIASLSLDVPWHITRYFPRYKYSEPPTPPTTLKYAQQVGHDLGLRYVYTGNLAHMGGEDTYCPSCDATLISRRGHGVTDIALSDGVCPNCDTKIPGVKM